MEITLDTFNPRWYQVPIINAIEKKGFKKALLVWSRRCLSGDTHIIMSNGSFKELKDIRIGDEILSWNGSTFQKDTVADIWKTKKKPTRTIQSSSGLPVKVSDDHAFASLTNTLKTAKSYKWLKAVDLTQRHQVLNYGGHSTGNLSDPHLAEFLGYMVADGYIASYQQPKFTNTNMTILKRVAYLAKKCFGYEAIWRPKGKGYDLGFSNGTLGGGATPNKIKELFREYGCDVPKNKRPLLPLIYDFDSTSLKRFFAALIAADGCMYIAKQGFMSGKREVPPGCEITINCGINKEYAYGIYWLLRKLGIVPQKIQLDKTSNWKIRISRRHDIFTLLSDVRVYGKEERQQEVIAYAKQVNKYPSLWNGCYRNFIKINQVSEEQELYDIRTTKNHNFIANGYVVHNSGKDVTCWNLLIRQSLLQVGNYYYIFPSYAQGKKALWNSITIDGRRFLSFIPEELIVSTNAQEMFIRLKNNSTIQILGAANYDSLMGTNPRGIIFSEYAKTDPMALQYLLPVLNANDGFVVINSTPRGKNHFYKMYQIAKANPATWYLEYKTIDDLKHFPVERVQEDIRSGLTSYDLAQQEYWLSWDMGVSGAYYARYYDIMEREERITNVQWEPAHKVHTAWDLGIRDATCIIFFQSIGTSVHIIDSYQNTDEGLEHYIKYLQSKPYVYGEHFAPHDIKVRELGTGMSRLEKAQQLGVHFTLTPNLSIEDGIEAVRTLLPKTWIDQSNCKDLIEAIENYRKEWDDKKKMYKSRPLHDKHSHYADCLRYLALSLPKAKDGLSAQELDKRYYEAVYGTDQMPQFFRD